MAAYSSKDGQIWDNDATYTYYPHGPLKRVELGEDKVQGLDYTYTLNGWLKGINSSTGKPEDDLGRDGIDNSQVSPDVFSTALHYYNGDYSASNSFDSKVKKSLGAGPIKHPQYNGNIAAATTTNIVEGSISVLDNKPVAFAYEYDKLSRLTKVQNGVLSQAHDSWQSLNSTYGSTYNYDLNGNIQALLRRDDKGNTIDDLTYNYDNGGMNNQLSSIIENHATSHENGLNNDLQFSYDPKGNTVSTNEASHITWNNADKLFSFDTENGHAISYLYDAMGNRVRMKSANSGQDTFVYNFYIREAQGNQLAGYERLVVIDNELGGWKSITKLTDWSLYGSDRLGTWHPDSIDSKRPIRFTDISTPDIMPSFDYSPISTRVIGQKSYEIKDHLGNITAVVSDAKRLSEFTVSSNTVSYTLSANLLSRYHYYPYGMEMDKGYQVRVRIPCGTNPSDLYEVNDRLINTISPWIKRGEGADLVIDAAHGTFGTIIPYKSFAVRKVRTIKDNEYEYCIKLKNASNGIAKLIIFSAIPSNDYLGNGIDMNIGQNITDTVFTGTFTATGDTAFIAVFDASGIAGNVLVLKSFTLTNLTKNPPCYDTISTSQAGYAYRYNGQKTSPEIASGHQTALYWEYDSRTGRRWNLDPVRQYFLSQYATFGGNPISKVDVNGDSFGDFFNKKGDKIGTDGIDDGKKYLAKVDTEENQIKRTDREGGTTQFDNNKHFELPKDFVLRATLNVLYRTINPDNNGIYEEGSDVYANGAVWNYPRGSKNGINMTPLSLPGLKLPTLIASIHSHPTEDARVDGDGITSSSALNPSPDLDIPAFQNNSLNIIVGRLGSTVGTKNSQNGPITLNKPPLGAAFYGRSEKVMFSLTETAIVKILNQK